MQLLCLCLWRVSVLNSPRDCIPLFGCACLVDSQQLVVVRRAPRILCVRVTMPHWFLLDA
jgi:hypothetical protein